MTKKNLIKDWSEAITKMSEDRIKEDHKLSPSQGKMRYLKDYSRNIVEKVDYIEFTSALAHEGKISFEEAQKIIDWQQEQIEEDIKYLQGYLKRDEEDLKEKGDDKNESSN
jgi:hypothetical protein